MINLLTVLKGLLSLADVLAKYLHDKQLLDAGAYKSIAENNSDAIKKITAADLARRNLVSVQDDPNNTDNRR